jgi:tyrosyl-tRNA synthetase
MPAFPPVADQLALIRRGVEQITPENELATLLERAARTGRPLRVKYGIDPTGIDVHLGHTVPLRKIRQFQNLGHKAVIIIGNYTALVGDPSGRDQARARITQEQVEANARDYLLQVGKVIDLSSAEVVRNGDWFGSMSFIDILELTSKVTVAQLLTREDFARRHKAEQAIFLHECLYPIMQAFDSVVVGADVELGGTEQLYSFMLARDLQRLPAVCELAARWMSDEVKSRRLPDGSLPQQIGVMSPILVGTDGVRRMGKSLGNYIGISESPFDMMKKFMQIPDDCMKMFFELLTNKPLDEVSALLAGHPKDAKLELGRSVISDYHPGDAGAEAAGRWQREIGERGGLPSEIPTVVVTRHQLDAEGRLPAAALLKTLGLCPSTSVAIQKINEKAVFVHTNRNTPREAVTDRQQLIAVRSGLIVGVGKRQIACVQVNEA